MRSAVAALCLLFATSFGATETCGDWRVAVAAAMTTSRSGASVAHPGAVRMPGPLRPGALLCVAAEPRLATFSVAGRTLPPPRAPDQAA